MLNLVEPPIYPQFQSHFITPEDLM
jgi:hypothetical protein